MSDLSPDVLLPLLRGRLGRPYTFVPECASTQRLVGEDDGEGTLVASDHQTEGRGRLGHTWEDVPGQALLFSLLLRPDVDVARWPELSIVAGEAVAAAVGGAAVVSHPNDVMIAGRKVAGVLSEATTGRVVLGIGVNVNQRPGELLQEAAKPPTSLFIELGREVDRAALLAEILLRLEHGYDAWRGVS